MIVDSHPPVPTSAVFDPTTLMRNKSNSNGGGSAILQQQQARQRYWSGMTLSRPASMHDATNISVVPNQTGAKLNNKMPPHQQWTTPAEKEIYTPFKSTSGRATPLDDPYSPNLRSLNTSMNEYMPAPQDPRDRPPSRAMSIQSGLLGGGPFQRRLDRKSEGSVVYQPLTPTNHVPSWGNSMFNKPYGSIIDPFDQSNDLSLGGATPVPPLPHIQTLPRQLPLARNSGKPSPPDEPTHNNRQQIPQQSMNAYAPGGGANDLHPFHKPEHHGKSSSGNRVTVVPNGTVIGTAASSVSSGEIGNGNEADQDDEQKKGKRRRLSRQRDRKYSGSSDHDQSKISNLRIVEKAAALHVVLGVTLFALGLTRLLLLSVWGLGIELVYGVYVVLMGTLGLIGCRRRHYCSLAACYVMSVLSCILAIPPFVTGLLVTVPDSFHTVDPKLFTSPHEPYGVDIATAVICLLELVVAIVTSALGCSVIGRALAKWQRAEAIDMKHAQLHTGESTNRSGINQTPIFHTSVNITHPSMMK